jgi:hypothetical protein
VYRIRLAQDEGNWQPLVYTLKNIQNLQNAVNCFTSGGSISLSRRTVILSSLVFFLSI